MHPALILISQEELQPHFADLPYALTLRGVDHSYTNTYMCMTLILQADPIPDISHSYEFLKILTPPDMTQWRSFTSTAMKTQVFDSSETVASADHIIIMIKFLPSYTSFLPAPD